MTEVPTIPSETELASAQTDKVIGDEEYYRAELNRALEVITDKAKLNEVIASKTDRPELFLHDSAQMAVINWENPDTDIIDNFAPELKVSGEVIAEVTSGHEGQYPDTGLSPDEFVGEFGGRGLDSIDYAKQHGITPDMRMFGFSNLSRAAFVRMWMLFPDLTKKIMSVVEPRSLGAEVQAAYEIMSRLVDINDPLVRKNDGSVDEKYLTR